MNKGEPSQLVHSFCADGFLHIPAAVPSDLLPALHDGVEEAHRYPCPTGNPTELHRHQMFRRGPAFETILDLPPVIDVVEQVLGNNCHIIANNTVYTLPGKAIDHWHVDETVLVPLPDWFKLPAEVPMPIYVVTAMLYLDDVSGDLGPTQIVPGSHRSGQPVPEDSLNWDGRQPVTVDVLAGDCLLLNGQTWHRGAPNRTARSRRRVVQVTYGRRFIAQRFHPYVNVVIPKDLYDRSSDRRRRLLGFHGHGPYG